MWVRTAAARTRSNTVDCRAYMSDHSARLFKQLATPAASAHVTTIRLSFFAGIFVFLRSMSVAVMEAWPSLVGSVDLDCHHCPTLMIHTESDERQDPLICASHGPLMSGKYGRMVSMIEKRPGRPPAQGAVRERAIELLAERSSPSPSVRALRDWMQDGTVPNIASVDEITERWLDHVAEAATLIGRGKGRADTGRIILSLRGHVISTEQLASDAVSSLLNVGGPVESDDDDTPPESVDKIEGLVIRVFEEWSIARATPAAGPLVVIVNAVSLNDDDEKTETVSTKIRSVIQNIISSAMGGGVYEPKFLADAIAVLVDVSDAERSALAERLQVVLNPGWNRLTETISTTSIENIIMNARWYIAAGASDKVAALTGADRARSEYMCFVTAIYDYIRERDLEG